MDTDINVELDKDGYTQKHRCRYGAAERGYLHYMNAREVGIPAQGERIFIGLMTSDHQLNASREGSK